MGIYALVDCNNFYASCERVFNPKLEGKPVIVLSNNDGCIVARSDEVKALGIKRGTPAFKCQDLIKKHDIQVFSSNYALYADISQRVMATLEHFTPDIEIYSIDEAFLSLSGFKDDLTEYGRKIRQTVKQWTGIPVTIGIGPTKTLAKIAAKIAKKDKALSGVFDITNHPRADEILESIDVSDVWGVGRQYTTMLKKNGICNARQLKDAPNSWIKKRMTVLGLRTVLELRGTSCIPLDEIVHPRKEILSSRSFGKPVETLEELKEAAASYTARAAEKLRAQSSIASYIHVFVTTNPYRKEDPQYTNSLSIRLPFPTSSTPDLMFYAIKGIEAIYRPGYSYKKAGVMLTDLIPKDQSQLNLFIPQSSSKANEAIMNVLDEINAKWGKNTLKYAAEGIRQDWKLRCEHLSPRFTTRWDELPEAKA